MPAGLPGFTEDLLMNNAQSIYDQVVSFDRAAEPDEPLLIYTPFMQSLIDLGGVTLGKHSQKVEKHLCRQINEDRQKNKLKRSPTIRATPQVHSLFENFFSNEVDSAPPDKTPKKRYRCKICKACMVTNCGVCASCITASDVGPRGKRRRRNTNTVSLYLFIIYLFEN